MIPNRHFPPPSKHPSSTSTRANARKKKEDGIRAAGGRRTILRSAWRGGRRAACILGAPLLLSALPRPARAMEPKSECALPSFWTFFCGLGSYFLFELSLVLFLLVLVLCGNILNFLFILKCLQCRFFLFWRHPTDCFLCLFHHFCHSS